MKLKTKLWEFSRTSLSIWNMWYGCVKKSAGNHTYSTLVVWEDCGLTESFAQGFCFFFLVFFFGKFPYQLWNFLRRENVIQPWSCPTPGMKLWIISSTSCDLWIREQFNPDREKSFPHIFFSYQKRKQLLSWDFSWWFIFCCAKQTISIDLMFPCWKCIFPNSWEPTAKSFHFACKEVIRNCYSTAVNTNRLQSNDLYVLSPSVSQVYPLLWVQIQ